MHAHTIIALAMAAPSVVAADIWRVDAGAPLGGDGATWETAFNDLTDALAIAEPGDQVWVAGGVYTPDKNTGDRTKSFVLPAGVRVLGGFGGFESQLNQRSQDDPFPSILSGDLAGDDDLFQDGCGGGMANYAENSFHVVTAENVGPDTVLDGFVVTGGAATGANPDDRGGGLLCTNASPTIIQVGFIGNLASVGAGVYLRDGSNPTMTSCGFSFNNGDGAGAMQIGTGCGAQFTNPLFMFNRQQGNNGEAGALYVSDAVQPVRIVNGTFVGNTSTGAYDGLFVHPSAGTTVEVRNSIFWGNGNNSISDLGFVDVRYSCVEGGFAGEGNMAEDPQFVNVGCETLPFPDPRLLATSPCIDAADSLEYDGPYIDHFYLRPGQGRFVDHPDVTNTGVGVPTFLDMGAFEAPGASECLADVNGDGALNILDFVAYQALFLMGCN